ncbi:ABC transporter permease [Gordonia terrae]|uniref:ABC transporter permease n=1 Tax=Gordonia terrae TaxID=2055 RepID=A0A2I1R8C3_9ACTN|nr:ABC transporter permease [Gordonia terrae]PKZ65382.1 ABC transporter permease [Gordonia terrae]
MNGIGDAVVRIGPALVVVIVLLAGVAVMVNRRSGLARETVVATLRAAVQLAALAAVLAAVVPHLWASALFVAAMASAAAWTSARRVRPARPRVADVIWCAGPVAAPTIVIVTALVVAGVLPGRGIAVIPTAGIMLGGAMVTASLAGRRAHDELRVRRGEEEAALSLGFDRRDARMEIAGPASATALIPGLDQTRSVGLVTIPGAFVGMVLGGASVWAAAAMQLFVLIALLAVSSIAMVVTVELVAREHL